MSRGGLVGAPREPCSRASSHGEAIIVSVILTSSMPGNEGNSEEPQLQPELVKMKPEWAYKILFPKYSLERLPVANARNLAEIPIEFVIQTFFEGNRLFQAKEAGRGYVRRIDLPDFDQTIARALLIYPFMPHADLPKPHEVRDLTNPGEELGGGAKHVFSAPNPKALEIPADINAPIAPGTRSLLANIIGIARKSDHKPMAILIYLPGLRSPEFRRQKSSISFSRPNLVHTY